MEMCTWVSTLFEVLNDLLWSSVEGVSPSLPFSTAEVISDALYSYLIIYIVLEDSVVTFISSLLGFVNNR